MSKYYISFNYSCQGFVALLSQLSCGNLSTDHGKTRKCCGGSLQSSLDLSIWNGFTICCPAQRMFFSLVFVIWNTLMRYNSNNILNWISAETYDCEAVRLVLNNMSFWFTASSKMCDDLSLWLYKPFLVGILEGVEPSTLRTYNLYFRRMRCFN